MLATILAAALAATGASDWPERINLEPRLGVLASSKSVDASTPEATPRDPLIAPRIAL